MASLWEMFLIFLRIGSLTLGGGYVMIPIMEDEIVHKRGWIDEKEFIDILAVAQSFPGAIAINTSIYVGFKLRRLKGAIIASLGLILPPMVIISAAAALIIQYGQTDVAERVFKGIRPAVAGLITAAVFRLSRGVDRNLFNGVVVLLAFISVAFWGIHPIFVIVGSGTAGYLAMKHLEGRHDG